MGRVVTLIHGKGLGRKLLKTGIEQIRMKQNPRQILIEAQCYAVGFYEQEGFQICSDEFTEDGIPHIQMILKLPQYDQTEELFRDTAGNAGLSL